MSESSKILAKPSLTLENGGFYSVILFATPRTGSSFVGQRLSKAGFGVTREWMYKGRYYTGELSLNAVHSVIKTSLETVGRTFSTKIMWHDLFDDFLPILPYEAWPDWFGETRFLTIEREDKLGQVTSLLKARYDNEWYVRHTNKDLVKDVKHDDIVDVYGNIRINGILKNYHWILINQLAGERWIEKNNIPILKKLSYSNLHSDSEEVINLLRESGIPRIDSKSWHNSPVKQSNNTNDLLKAFVTETLKVTEDEFNSFTTENLNDYLKEFEKDDTNISFKDFLVNHS